MKTLITTALTTLLTTVTHGQDLTHKAPPLTEPYALVGGTVHVEPGRAMALAYVLVNADGTIETVGKRGQTPPEGTREIDCTGLQIYPGLIGANTRLGLTEISSVRATRDHNEVGRITPEVRAAVAVNPDSTLIPVTRSNGVLAVGVFPTGGIIPGRASVMQLDGWTSEDMTVLDDAGLHINWPLSRVVTAWWMDKTEQEQLDDIRKNAGRIRNTFSAARAYLRARDADDTVPIDLRYEAMRSVLDGDRPVFVAAQDYEQIVAAVAFAHEEDLRMVIVGGRDSHLCTELLVEHDIGVIVNGVFGFPKRDDSPYDAVYTLPLTLKEAGVRFCLASGEETAHERSLPYSAAMAVAHGLTEADAMASITIDAARMLGVDDRLGTIEAGKDATLIVTNGSPLEVTTRFRRAFIMGREIDLSNKQTKLDEKYREKYRQIGATPEDGD